MAKGKEKRKNSEIVNIMNNSYNNAKVNENPTQITSKIIDSTTLAIANNFKELKYNVKIDHL